MVLVKDELQPVAGAEDGVVGVGVEGDEVRGPVVPVEVLQRGRVGGEFDGVGVALGAEEVDAFGEGGEEAGVADVDGGGVGIVDYLAGSLDLDGRVFADEDGDIGVVGCLG